MFNEKGSHYMSIITNYVAGKHDSRVYFAVSDNVHSSVS